MGTPVRGGGSESQGGSSWRLQISSALLFGRDARALRLLVDHQPNARALAHGGLPLICLWTSFQQHSD